MGKYYNGKLKSIEETKSLHFTLHCNYSWLHITESLTLSCTHPHSFIKVTQFFRKLLRDAVLTVNLVGQRIFRVGESITHTWKSYSI